MKTSLTKEEKRLLKDTVHMVRNYIDALPYGCDFDEVEDRLKRFRKLVRELCSDD